MGKSVTRELYDTLTELGLTQAQMRECCRICLDAIKSGAPREEAWAMAAAYLEGICSD